MTFKAGNDQSKTLSPIKVYAHQSSEESPLLNSLDAQYKDHNNKKDFQSSEKSFGFNQDLPDSVD